MIILNLYDFLRSRSLRVFFVDGGGCCGCTLQFWRFLHTRGVSCSLVAAYENADISVLSGSIDIKKLEKIFDGEPDIPVIAIGSCAAVARRLSSPAAFVGIEGCMPDMERIRNALKRFDSRYERSGDEFG